MSFRRLMGGAAVVAIASACAIEAQAQETSSSVRGVVSGPGGAPVAGAQVTLIHTPSGTAASATTNASGGYFASGLRVGGPYTITFVASGLQGAQVTDVYLAAGNPEPISVTLESATEVIVVTGQATHRLGLNNGVGSSFSASQIGNQPSTTRDVIRTLLRDPLAQSSGTGNLSVAGVNPRFNGLSIDGSLQKDDLGLGANTYATERSPINLDAVEAVSLVASDYSVTASGFTGGLINIVTKSGTNELDGAAFYYYADQDFYGDEAFGDTEVTTAPFEEKEYGLSLGGPIIRDRLFFFGSYDYFESASGVDFSTSDSVNGIEPGFFDALNQLVLDTYGIDMQGRPTTASTPVTSERYLGKIDWNINPDHRASFTYQQTEETGTTVSAGSFVSAWYDTPVELTAYTGQLFSDWTPNFSTTLRANYKEFSRGQICRAGSDQAHLEFGLDDSEVGGTALAGLLTSNANNEVFIGGCDRFRHANAYDDSRLQLFGSADYTAGDHVITLGGELQQFELFNVFNERSNARFTFDNVNEILTGDAVFVDYINDVSNDKNAGAAAWGYDTWVAFVQDAWQLTPTFELDAGVRYEYYATEDTTPADAGVESDYGFDPVTSLDGLDLIMPRLGFRWDPLDDTTISGGIGLFAGGNPNVWFSNAYTPGFVSTSGVFNDIDPAVIPQTLLDNVANGTPRIIDVIDPDFEIPSDWKASVRVEHEFDLDFGGFDLGEGYLATAQVLYTKSNESFLWENIAQTQLASTQPRGVAPDGRPIYADLQALGIPNVTMLTNGDAGESLVLSASLSKSYDFGLNFDIGYAHQDVEAITEGTSSRGISSWRGITAIDRNFPDARTSPFEVEHSFRFSLGYEHAFVRDLATRFDLFAQINSGTPFTFSYDLVGSATSSDSLFGRAGGGEGPFDNNPLYIPTPGSDPLVVYGSAFDQAGFFDYMSTLGVPTGEIHEVNSGRSAWNQQWDFRFQQELPGLFGADRFLGENRFKFVVDVQNVANLLNSDWGTNYNGPSNNQLGIVQADLISATDPQLLLGNVDGATALSGDAFRTTCVTAASCVYRYRDFDADPTSFRTNPGSVYRIRVGLRYEF